MPHFFIDSNAVIERTITISEKETYTHIAKSLRSKIGEKLLLIDENEMQYEGTIENISSNNIKIKITNSYKSTKKLDFSLYLAQSPLRSDAQSLIIEKATELGIEGIYPIFTDNCSLAKNVIDKKIPKWQKIMSESSKQCERANIPTCFELTTIQKLAENVQFDRIFAFTEREASDNLKSYLRKNPTKKGEKTLVIIGPEGGFSNREFDYFKTNPNIITLSLGSLILRAETAVITAIGNIVYEHE